MMLFKRLLLAAVLLGVSEAWGQAEKREPHLGYAYPAGGRQGAVIQVLAGGQRLQGANSVYVSGAGVHASVIRSFRPFRMIKAEQRRALEQQLLALMEQRWNELPESSRVGEAPWRRFLGKGGVRKAAVAVDPADLPDHPLLMDVENKSLRELEYIGMTILNIKKKQPNTQIAEMLLLEVTIDSDATPGDRELRLGAQGGLTNPLCFQVGQLPEAREQEPNDPKVLTGLADEPPLELPVLMNGQIEPGDVDRFRFRAKKGQRLVMAVAARHLIPYLADAVPGWFQPMLTLYDPRGAEVAFADDYRFDPDPVLLYEVPEDGAYSLEIRDSIYRGREDFIYRVSVGELPFITQVYPLGGPEGAVTTAAIGGWNLKDTRLNLDTQPGFGGIRQTALRQDFMLSNSVPYAVDTLPEAEEQEPNDAAESAQRVLLPLTLNGRIGQPGDVDTFQFEGRANDEVVAEVFARRLRSPLDALLRLTGDSGKLIEWNDDCEDKSAGWCTHHADARLSAKLPADGTYRIAITDAQRQGDDACAYRLRLAPPQPDFALRMAPASLSLPPGRAVPLCVYALRKDGFSGEIEVAMKDAPDGFALDGARIPAGKDSVRMTLTAPRETYNQPIPLQLEGRAVIAGQAVTRPVVAAEDMMQAFAYRHLVPSGELQVAVIPSRLRAGAIERAGDTPVRIPAGGQVQVQFDIPRLPNLENLAVALSEPPKGISLEGMTLLPRGLAFVLKADGDAAKAGLADNLIVEVSADAPPPKQTAKRPKQSPRAALGYLPAIPVEVVQP